MPNKPEWVQEHIQRYTESGGADGHIWREVTTLLLTTTGRHSGNPDTTPLIYGRSGGAWLLIASRGGAPTHPQWYLNLRANPAVEIQVAAERFAVNARTANAAEKAELWPLMTAIWPAYDEYQAKTDRDIPLVILEQR